MEFYAITSTWACVGGGRGHSKDQKPLGTGGLVTGSTEARRGGKGRGGPTPLACLPARSEDQTWWGPRGGGPWAHGHPPTAWGWPAHLGEHRNRSGPVPGEVGSPPELLPSPRSGTPGVSPTLPLVPRAAGARSGAGKAAPPSGCCSSRHPWCPQLVALSLRPVTLTLLYLGADGSTTAGGGAWCAGRQWWSHRPRPARRSSALPRGSRSPGPALTHRHTE